MTPEDEIDDVLDLLSEYEGETLVDLVEAVLAEVDWLKEQMLLAQEQLYSCTSGSKKLAAQVARAREVMEANDPLNAREIFGPQGDGNGEEARQHSASETKTQGADSSE